MSAELSSAGGAFTPLPSPFRNARLVLEDYERGKTFHFLLLRVAGRKVFVRVSHLLRFAYDVKYIAERFLLTGAYF